VSKSTQVDTRQFRGVDLISNMKAKELTPDQMLAVRFRTRGARLGEPCELQSGGLRTEPHRDRKLSAADAVKRQHQRHGLGDDFVPTLPRKSFCEMRNNLLVQVPTSASRVFATTTRLNKLVGTRNPIALTDARTEARLARAACQEARTTLARHRCMHGC
jgi:hypothetical protein